MATARITTLNLTCLKLGLTTITDPQENSPRALVLNAALDRMAQRVLRKHAWSCAMKKVSLPTAVQTQPWGMANVFPLPADFMRLVEVQDGFFGYGDLYASPDDPPLYQIESGNIVTDLPAPLNIRYVYDISGTPAQWDVCLEDCIACALGIECAPTLTKSPTKKAELQKEYAMAVAEARKVNAIELPAQRVADGSWLQARLF